MYKKCWLLPFLMLFLLACRDGEQATATPLPTVAATARLAEASTPTAPATVEPLPTSTNLLTDGIVISEVMIDEVSAMQFVELYNAGSDLFDLNGHVLIYRDVAGEERAVHIWTTAAFVPPHGHYLLANGAAQLDVVADQNYAEALSAESGTLLLRAGSQVLPDSQFEWGSNELTLGDASSLERLPGGRAGSGQATGVLADDYVVQNRPNPQNSGSPPTPPFTNSLAISIDVPNETQSGADFSYLVRISNNSGRDLTDVTVSIPFDDRIQGTRLPAGANVVDDRLTWTIATMLKDATVTEPLFVQAPFEEVTLVLSGAYVSAVGATAAFANIATLSVSGGVVPIRSARVLIGQTVTVEGVVTLSTGGFYTPNDGRQFYLQDQNGGIKVFVPIESGRISIAAGERVRVTGDVRQWRGSIELVPAAVVANITKLGRADEPVRALSIVDAVAGPGQAETVAADSTNIGELATVKGVASRIETRPQWLEIDLIAAEDVEISIRIDSETDVTVESFGVGQTYVITGIIETIEADTLLLPRVQMDIVEQAPSGLQVRYLTPPNVPQFGQDIHRIELINNSDGTLRSVIVKAAVPRGANDVWAGDAFNASGNGQIATDGNIYWGVNEIVVGASELLSFTVQYSQLGEARAALEVSADSLQQPIQQTNRIFIGQSVPIAAVQGSGDRSPFVGQEVMIEGAVSATFPGLSGFWLQSVAPDGDPATSEGIFVQPPLVDPTLQYGNYLRVRGRVEERQGQTTLVVEDGSGIGRLSSPVDLTLLAPVTLAPPSDALEAASYYESLEGMTVAIGSTADVFAPTDENGETVFLLRSSTDALPVGELPPFALHVDDGSVIVHQDASTVDETFQRGDRLRRYEGVLAYADGRFKIQPYAATSYDQGFTAASDAAPTLRNDGKFSVASFNAHNFFDHIGTLPRDIQALTQEAFLFKLDKIAAAIVAQDAPAIVALQEVEDLAVLEALVATVQLDDFEYTPYLIEGSDERGINNGFLVRKKLVPVRSVEAFPGLNGLTQRPPLVLHTALGDRPLFVVNVHLVSAESHESTSLASRTAQSAWVARLVERLQTENPTAEIIVLGSFDSEQGSPPLVALEVLGLQNSYAALPEDADAPYTLIKDGVAYAPDHVLISADLHSQIVSTTPLHINTHYPVPTPDDRSATASSDHDPLIVIFDVEVP